MSEVASFIDQDVSIRRGLSRGFVNVRALAAYIKERLETEASLDAIISAIRRYETKERHEDILRRYKILAGAKIASRSRMCSLLLRKEPPVRRAIGELLGKVAYTKGEVLRVLEASAHLKVIIDQSNLEIARRLFEPRDIVEVDPKLGEIGLIYAEDIRAVPGVFSALSSELTLAGIAIRDGIICGSEHIIIVHEHDLMRALQVLDSVVRWGERRKIK